jgi:hypothetical protein
MVETPSSCATVFRLSGLLWYFDVEVREITLRSRTVANLVRIDDESGDDRGEQKQSSCPQRPTRVGAFFLESLKRFRKLRVPDVLGEEIDDAKLHTMFYFAGAKIVQRRSPFLELSEIFCDVFREQNVASITTAHHAPRQIQTSASEVRVTSYIHHSTDRSL